MSSTYPHPTIYPFHVQYDYPIISLSGESGTHPQRILAGWLLNIQKPNKVYRIIQKPKKEYKIGTKAARGEIVANYSVKEGSTEEEEMNLTLEE